MAEPSRTCRRTGCRGPAAASLSFRYATRQAWLVELTPRAEPALYDLCPRHADTLTVPRGWQRVDDRGRGPASSAPAGGDLVDARHEPVVADSGDTPAAGRTAEMDAEAGTVAGGRYAGLWAQLPRLAAKLAQHADDGPLAGHVEVEGQLRMPVDVPGEVWSEPGEVWSRPEEARRGPGEPLNELSQPRSEPPGTGHRPAALRSAPGAGGAPVGGGGVVVPFGARSTERLD